MRDPWLNEAIRVVGSISELARQLGISQPSVSNWSKVPAERVLSVETLTASTWVVLRPDLFGASNAAGDVDEGRCSARAGILRCCLRCCRAHPILRCSSASAACAVT
ncbi:MAG: Cro/CI family transcriptional regulator [Pseudolabrys sp.]